MGHFAPQVLVPLALLATGAGCSGDDTNPPLPSSDGGTDAYSPDASVDGNVSDALPSEASADGTTDGPASDAPAAADGATDAPSDVTLVGDGAASGLLSCASWRYGTPVTLEDLSADDAQGLFMSEVWVSSPAAGVVRVVAQPAPGPSFRVYGFDKSTSAVTTLNGPSISATSIVSVRPFAVASSTGSEILLQNEAKPGDSGQATQLAAYLVPDTMPVTGPLPSPIALSAGFGSAVAIPFSATSVFDVVTYLESTGGPTIYYGLGVGLASASSEATLSEVSASPEPGDFGSLAAAHASGNVYVFGSNASSHPGESVWTVPDTAVVPSELPFRAFDTGNDGRMIDVAPAAATAGATNLAYWTTATDGASSALHVGAVANAELASVTATDLVTARTYPDVGLADATLAAVWHGDDMMIIGPDTGSADAGTQPGARLLWVDANGDVRGEQLGASAILQNRTGVRLAGASPASITATTATWDVAWIETHADGSESLLYNELDCQPGD